MDKEFTGSAILILSKNIILESFLVAIVLFGNLFHNLYF